MFSKFSYLKENSKNKEALIAYDYDNTTEDDFNDLVSKCGRLKETNSHLEKSIDEYKKFQIRNFLLLQRQFAIIQMSLID